MDFIGQIIFFFFSFPGSFAWHADLMYIYAMVLTLALLSCSATLLHYETA